MTKEIGKRKVHQFFELASEVISGEWVLVGGTLLPYLGREVRVTTDIDFAPVKSSSSSDTLKLMDTAVKLGFSVETINQAADYFLKKIPNFEEKLVLLYQKRKLKVFRPNSELFVQLKLGRMSESDLLDCLEFLDYAKEVGEKLYPKKTIERIQRELGKNDQRYDRLEVLLKRVQSEEEVETDHNSK